MFPFNKALLVVIFISFGMVTVAYGQTSTPAPSSCVSKSNTSCEECLSDVNCLWCGTNSQCMDYPVKSILPTRVCSLSKARWGACWVNFQTLIITMSVLAGALILALLVCCCCCCKCEKIGNKKEDERAARQARDRAARHEERRTEMKLRHEQIRQKYGLTKGKAYTRMEDE